jgi:GTPase
MNHDEMREERGGKEFRSGFVAVIGKPNVGKSTLINAITGSHIAIVSSKPQTTRHRILGVYNGEGCQIVFVDTPGVHEAKNEFGRLMDRIAGGEIKDADVILYVADVSRPPDDNDRRTSSLLRSRISTSTPLFLVLNKTDLIKGESFKAHRNDYFALGDHSDVFAISALKGEGINELIDRLIPLLPVGPEYFPPSMRSDQSFELMAAELVREKILERTHQEIPHSVFVHTEESRRGKKKDDVYLRLIIYVERESHKKIIIGKSGSLLKKIGILSRKELQAITGKEVYLDLWVKVKEKWKDRKDLLRSWGYEV